MLASGCEIDDQFDSGRLLNGKVGGTGAAKNTVGILGGQNRDVEGPPRICDQASVVGKPTDTVDGGKSGA